MRYLVDADWVIHSLHGVDPVIRSLDELTPEGVGISIVSVAELYRGVFYTTDPVGNEEILQEFIQGYEVVQLDDDICRIFPRERGSLKEVGTPICDLDLLIGSTALRHGVTLLTNNRRYFDRLSGLNLLRHNSDD